MKKTMYPHQDRPWMKYYDEDLVSKEDPKTNLASYIRQKNEGNEKGVAQTYYGAKTSYAELFEKIDAYSKMLVSLGVGEGSRIMYLVPNIPESGILWLAGSQIGAVSDFVDPRPDTMDLEANAKKFLEIIKHEKANFIVALDKCYLGILKPIENELKELGIDKVVIVSATDSMNLLGKLDYLRDVIEYNRLRNIRIAESQVQRLRACQALIAKIREMKKESKLFKEAIKSSVLEVLSAKELLKECQHVSFTPKEDESLISYIGHTSGTSGSRPKPIALTNANQISAVEQIFKAGANFKVNDRILHELPFFAPMGANNNYLLNLASGANNIEIPEFEINEFGYLLKKYHPNVILGTPSWIASLPSCEYLDKEDLSCITRIIYGGDSMTLQDEENINEWLKNHGSKAEVEKGHGMSEYCGCGSYAKGEYNRCESIGIPLPDTIYTIVDPNVDERLVPVPFEEDKEFLIGELAVSSPAVTCGMLDDEVIVPHFVLEGNDYIRTRDLVKMDRNGIFSFDSRKDRSFTRFDGYKVKPFEIEHVIEENENVKYCRIVEYYDDKQRGLMPIAHVVLEENIDNQEEIDIISDIVYNDIIANPNMSSRQIPSKFKIRDNMPLTKNGKVNFRSLVEEELDDTIINVDVEETNLSVGKINIYKNKSGKIKTRR